MPRPAINDHASPESRAKGARAANEAKTRKRAERLAKSEERFESAAEQAIAKLLALLNAEDEGVQLRAAVAILDRALGKPQQRHEHGGSVEVNVEVAQVREQLTTRLADRASRLRPK